MFELIYGLAFLTMWWVIFRLLRFTCWAILMAHIDERIKNASSVEDLEGCIRLLDSPLWSLGYRSR